MHEKSIELLNRAVSDELYAVHQYMYFHFHCDNQGYEYLSQLFMKSAIDEMGHVERIADRILFLKGDVELKASEEVMKIKDAGKMLERACDMERQAINDYNQWALECATDATTRKMFEEMVADEENHYDQYDNELENMGKYGDNYLALQSIERTRNMLTQGGPPAEKK